MKRSPPVSRVVWPGARRIIASRFPPIDLFEDIADPRDWDLIADGESKTNPRIAESAGRLDLVPPERRVAGPGASYAMAPFTHVSPDWAGRFHDGTFGAFYAASRFETAIAETAYHRARFYRASGEAPGWIAQMRELICPIDRAFHDIRGARRFASCLAPDSYVASQALAVALRKSGSDGIVYPSVRDSQGEAIAAFWPDAVGRPVQGRHLDYHFDGTRIDLVRDSVGGLIWRLGDPIT